MSKGLLRSQFRAELPAAIAAYPCPTDAPASHGEFSLVSRATHRSAKRRELRVAFWEMYLARECRREAAAITHIGRGTSRIRQIDKLFRISPHKR